MASYLWNAPFFVKLGFNVFARNRDSRPFVNISIYDYLWNFTDPLLRTANTLMPHMVPVEDMGMLSRVSKCCDKQDKKKRKLIVTASSTPKDLQ